MAQTELEWPKKRRVIQEGVVDSTLWDRLKFRDDDILIDTFAKAGTNWTLQIVAQLLYGGAEDRVGMAMGAQLEFTWMPIDTQIGYAEAITERRFFRSHLPIDALPFDPKLKYICVGRDARDIVWSAHNHRASFTPVMIDVFKDAPGWNPDIHAYYLHWLEHDDGMGIWAGSLWRYAQSCWAARTLPNVLLVHFNSLKADMPGEIRRIARFLDLPIEAAAWSAILEHCSFDYMREAGAKIELLKRNFREGGKTIINKGTNGRWKDILSPAEIARCDELAVQRLGPQCAHWLQTGELRSSKQVAI